MSTGFRKFYLKIEILLILVQKKNFNFSIILGIFFLHSCIILYQTYYIFL